MCDKTAVGQKIEPETRKPLWQRKQKIEVKRRLCAFLKNGDEDHKSVAARLESCGKFAHCVVLNQRGDRVVRRYCSSRICPFCADVRAANFRRRFTDVADHSVKQGKRLTAFTLTIAHKAGDDLGTLLDGLMRAWNRFTRSVCFKRHIGDWVKGVEFEHGENGWHPHIHFVAEAEFLRQSEVSDIWRRCVEREGLATERLVHLHEVRDQGKGIAEAVGYPIKGSSVEKLSEALVLELSTAMKARKLVTSSRGWQRLAKVLEEAKEEIPDDPESIVLSWDDVREIADNPHHPNNHLFPRILAALEREDMKECLDFLAVTRRRRLAGTSFRRFINIRNQGRKHESVNRYRVHEARAREHSIDCLAVGLNPKAVNLNLKG